MHRYFLIPVICFFLIVLSFVIYLQLVNENWKYLAPKIDLPDSCNDKNDVELVTHDGDYVEGRSFIDSKDIIKGLERDQISLFNGL